MEEEDLTSTPPVAGESAQARYERERAALTERLLRGAPLLGSVGVLLVIGSYFVSVLAGADLRWAAIAPVATTGIVLWLILRLPAEVVYWGKGAEGERRVGAKLDSLEPAGFVTLYDRRLPGRGGNIDAVTIGPPGVFVVESKHRGRNVEIVNARLEVGGREQPDSIRQVTDVAMLVQVSIAQAINRHRLTVVPVICIANRKVSGGDRAGGVLVLDEKSIAKRLTALPAVLSADEVHELSRTLDNALPPYQRRS